MLKTTKTTSAGNTKLSTGRLQLSNPLGDYATAWLKLSTKGLSKVSGSPLSGRSCMEQVAWLEGSYGKHHGYGGHAWNVHQNHTQQTHTPPYSRLDT